MFHPAASTLAGILSTSTRLTRAGRFEAVLNHIAEEVEGLADRGRPTDCVPLLAEADPRHFGMAVAEADGAVYGVGDWKRPFSTQSITKVLTLAMALSPEGEHLWRGVGRVPSGNPFNSLVQPEHENGVPRNPFINAGALVVTDRLQALTADAAGRALELLRTESGNPTIDFVPEVAACEATHGGRNAALAHFMASCGNLTTPVPDLLAAYSWQCSIAASCKDLALAAGFLARHVPADHQAQVHQTRGTSPLPGSTAERPHEPRPETVDPPEAIDGFLRGERMGLDSLAEQPNLGSAHQCRCLFALPHARQSLPKACRQWSPVPDRHGRRRHLALLRPAQTHGMGIRVPAGRQGRLKHAGRVPVPCSSG
ncbi:glutaminase [Streptomyces sp. NPDC000963]